MYLESAAAGLPKEPKGAGRIDGMLSGQNSMATDARLAEPGQRDLAATFALNGSRIGGRSRIWIGYSGKGKGAVLLLTLSRSSCCGRRWGSGVILLQSAERSVLGRVRYRGRWRGIAHSDGGTHRQRCVGQGDVALGRGRGILAALESLQRALLPGGATQAIRGVHAVHPLGEKLLDTLHDDDDDEVMPLAPLSRLRSIQSLSFFG